MDPIALTIGQMFEIEKFSREIDGSKDVEELQAIAKQLLVAWKQQQAASAWIIRQQQGLWLLRSTALSFKQERLALLLDSIQALV